MLRSPFLSFTHFPWETIMKREMEWRELFCGGVSWWAASTCLANIGVHVEIDSRVWLTYRGAGSATERWAATQPPGFWSAFKPLSPCMPAANDNVITDWVVSLKTSFVKPHQTKFNKKRKCKEWNSTSNKMQDNLLMLINKTATWRSVILRVLLSSHPFQMIGKLILAGIPAAAAHLESRGHFSRIMATTTN